MSIKKKKKEEEGCLNHHLRLAPPRATTMKSLHPRPWNRTTATIFSPSFSHESHLHWPFHHREPPAPRMPLHCLSTSTTPNTVVHPRSHLQPWFLDPITALNRNHPRNRAASTMSSCPFSAISSSTTTTTLKLSRRPLPSLSPRRRRTLSHRDRRWQHSPMAGHDPLPFLCFEPLYPQFWSIPCLCVLIRLFCCLLFSLFFFFCVFWHLKKQRGWAYCLFVF